VLWKQAFVAAAALGLLAVPGPAWAGPEATGTWRMANGKVTVRVSRCGPNLCGTVVGLRKPRDRKGKPRLDKENPNPTLRSRPVMGLTIMRNMRANGAGRWSGTIYNPDDGKTYSAYMTLDNAKTMQVEGCVAGIFCRNMKFIKLD
jgi:uncharacterized protein (DUF2147 family)